MSLSGRVCLVTGGTAGIGKATAAALAGKGATVVIAARSEAKGAAVAEELRQQSGHAAVSYMRCDLASLDSIRRFAREFSERYPACHVLVNNAGVINKTRMLTADGFEGTFGVNHLGPFLLTNLLLGQLKAGAPARVVTVSSGAHVYPGLDFTDLQSERSYQPMKAYSLSKLANILFTYELARRLAGTGVTANCLHPGFVRTEIFGEPSKQLLARLFAAVAEPFVLTPEQGAETSVFLAADPAVEGVSGKYFVKRRPRRSSRRSYDLGLARRLWDVSAALTGLA